MWNYRAKRFVFITFNPRKEMDTIFSTVINRIANETVQNNIISILNLTAVHPAAHLTFTHTQIYCVIVIYPM